MSGITAVQTGSGWDVDDISPASGGGAVYYPSANTFGGVMDAIAKAQAVLAAGKTATVKFLPELYDLAGAGQGFPVLSGLTYEGSDWRGNVAHSPTGGTIIKGDGTFDTFFGNHVDLGSPPVDMGAMHALGIYGTHIRDLSILNPRCGIKVGAKWLGGAYKSSIKNVRIQDNTGWGVDLENWQYSSIVGVSSGPAIGGVGAGRFSGSVPNSIFNHGNLYISDLFSEGGNYKTRGWCVHAYGGNSNFNDIFVNKAQRNASGVKITVAATMSNGSPDIAVADSSAFPVDLPVTVSASANGFSVQVSYFVVYSSANVIRLAKFMGGAPQNATGSTAISIITYGFPSFEFAGFGDPAAGNIIQPSSAFGLDAEGFGTHVILAQNANMDLRVGTVFNGQNTSQASTICARQASGSLSSVGAVIPDFDSQSAQNFQAVGLSMKVSGTTTPQDYPQGIVKTDTGITGLNIGSIPNASVRVSLYPLQVSGQAFHYPANPMGQRVQTSTTTSTTLGGQQAGCIGYVGTSNATWTLPTITGTAGSANTWGGNVFEICNASTTAGVTLTINTAAGQPFNRQAGKTSVVLAVGQSFTVRAQTNNGSDWFWQITGNNGVTI